MVHLERRGWKWLGFGRGLFCISSQSPLTAWKTEERVCLLGSQRSQSWVHRGAAGTHLQERHHPCITAEASQVLAPSRYNHHAEGQLPGVPHPTALPCRHSASQGQ